MTLRLYDTYSRSTRDFEPLNPPVVGLYTCGPTVYDYAHIGNLRTYVFEDILRRVLEFNGYTVRHVTNITDVGHLTSDADTGEDKMEMGAKRQMEWDSPWGVGFPGWHIECTAMSAKYLGPLRDIHCGGEDHISVHHTNEIAQAQACYDTNLANFWLHGYFLQLDDEKMAKSSGGFLRLQALIDRGYDPLAYRYFCLGGHYRSKLNFTWEALDGAATALDRLRATSYEWGDAGRPDDGYMDRFIAHINHDLNVPRALALTWELAKCEFPPSTKKATLFEFDKVLGLGLAEWEPPQEVVPDNIMALVEQRQRARAEKRWQEADTLRDQIWAAGYEVEDTPEGPQFRARRFSEGDSP